MKLHDRSVASRTGTPLQRSLVAALGLVSLCCACTDHDARINSRVVSIGADEVCLRPEDAAVRALAEGCYPISDDVARRLSTGDCITAITPDGRTGPLDEQLRSVRVLDDGACER